MNILLTICFRKGSKRLPGKNVKDFCGKPLWEWTYENAIYFKNYIYNSHKVDIAVCTDENIDVSEKIHRPKEISGDKIPKLDTIRYAYNYIENQNNKKYHCVIDLDVTAPLRFVGQIEDALDVFIKEERLSLFSVVPSRRNPEFNQVKLYTPIFGDKYYVNTVNGHNKSYKFEYYDLNASIYVYSSEYLKSNTNESPINFDGMSSIYVMKDWQFIDIDRQLDWDIAEMLFKKYILGDKS